MIDFITIGIIFVIVAAAGIYVYKAKKSGQKCIGCPESCSCGTKKQTSGCSCCNSVNK